MRREVSKGTMLSPNVRSFVWIRFIEPRSCDGASGGGPTLAGPGRITLETWRWAHGQVRGVVKHLPTGDRNSRTTLNIGRPSNKKEEVAVGA